MSLEKIKRELKEVIAEEGMFTFVDDSIVRLLIAIAEHMLEINNEDCSVVPETHILLTDFEKKYIFVAANTLYKYCKHDHEFNRICALLVNGRWYVDEQKTIQFLSHKPVFKNRIAKNFFQEKLSPQ